MQGIKKIIANFLNKITHKQIKLPLDRYEIIIDDIIKSNFINELENRVRQSMSIETIGSEYGKNLKNEKSIYNYPLQTTLTKDQTIELTKDFFESIDCNFANNVNEIIEGNNTRVELKMPDYNGTQEAEAGNPDNTIIPVIVPIRGDLRDLYGMVHELTHTFDIGNGDTTTRKVLGEVAPQCMERMLDEYLLNLSQESLMKYGIDKDILYIDIRNRKVTTFLSRVDNANEFNEKTKNNCISDDGKRDLRYVLAQIYQARFMKFDSNTRKRKIIDFVKNVENDELEQANKVLELNVNNPIQRDFYIIDTIAEINDVIKIENEKKDCIIEENLVNENNAKGEKDGR